MKKVSPNLYITALTLLLSVVLTMSFGCNSFRSSNDSKIYQATVCELAEKPNDYDGKFVRLKAIHNGLGVDTPTSLGAFDCDSQIWVTCKMDDDSCFQMNTKLRSIGGLGDPQGMPQIDVVGRFKADSELPQMLSEAGTKRGKLLEITELKDIETVRNPNRF